jgi:hypothetical protein
MSSTKIKEILAVINIASLLTGSGIMLGGCSGDKNKDVSSSESQQKESKQSEVEGDLHKEMSQVQQQEKKSVALVAEAAYKEGTGCHPIEKDNLLAAIYGFVIQNLTQHIHRTS